VKTCTECEKLKPISDFSPVVTNKDGHANRCKECMAFYNREVYRIKQLAKGKRLIAQRENVQKERGE
jgi:hypothetical protein